MAIDLTPMWDFGNPALSEEHFRAAIIRAAPDDSFILQTQIARTYGLRGDFAQARAVLAQIEPGFAMASPEAQVRWLLESGRTWASPGHSPEQLTADGRGRARPLYMRAFELAREAKLDGLAIDALHMMVMVDNSPEQQLEWNRKAIAYMEASDQPAAKRWAGALYNNIGYALEQAGRLDEALVYYQKALSIHESAGRVEPARIARWMIARTLREQGSLQQALEIQRKLEIERDADGKPSPYVWEELEKLHRVLGDEAEAARYAAKRKKLSVQ